MTVVLPEAYLHLVNRWASYLHLVNRCHHWSFEVINIDLILCDNDHPSDFFSHIQNFLSQRFLKLCLIYYLALLGISFSFIFFNLKGGSFDNENAKWCDKPLRRRTIFRWTCGWKSSCWYSHWKVAGLGPCLWCSGRGSCDRFVWKDKTAFTFSCLMIM